MILPDDMPFVTCGMLAETYPVSKDPPDWWQRNLKKWRDTGKLIIGDHYKYGVVDGSDRMARYYNEYVILVLLTREINNAPESSGLLHYMEATHGKAIVERRANLRKLIVEANKAPV